MKTKFELLMRELFELSQDIGAKSDDDERYAAIYGHLSNALDEAVASGLIVAGDEDEDEY